MFQVTPQANRRLACGMPTVTTYADGSRRNTVYRCRDWRACEHCRRGRSWDWYQGILAVLREHRTDGRMITLTLPGKKATLEELENHWRRAQAVLRKGGLAHVTPRAKGAGHKVLLKRAMSWTAERFQDGGVAGGEAADRPGGAEQQRKRVQGVRSGSPRLAAGLAGARSPRAIVIRELGTRKGRPHLHVLALDDVGAARIARAWMAAANPGDVTPIVDISDFEAGDAQERAAAYVSAYVSKDIVNPDEIPRGKRLISAIGGVRLRLQRKGGALKARLRYWPGRCVEQPDHRVPDFVRPDDYEEIPRYLGELRVGCRATSEDVAAVFGLTPAVVRGGDSRDLHAPDVADCYELLKGCATRRDAALEILAQLRSSFPGGDIPEIYLVTTARGVYKMFLARAPWRSRGIVPANRPLLPD